MLSWCLLLALIHIKSAKHIATGILLRLLLSWGLVHEAECVILIGLLLSRLLVHEAKSVVSVLGVGILSVVHCHASEKIILLLNLLWLLLWLVHKSKGILLLLLLGITLTCIISTKKIKEATSTRCWGLRSSWLGLWLLWFWLSLCYWLGSLECPSCLWSLPQTSERCWLCCFFLRLLCFGWLESSLGSSCPLGFLFFSLLLFPLGL